MTGVRCTIDVFQLTGTWLSRRWAVGHAYHSDHGPGGCGPLIAYATREEACAVADRVMGRLWGEWPDVWPDGGVSFAIDLDRDQLADAIGRDAIEAYHVHSAAEFEQYRARSRAAYRAQQGVAS